MSTIFSDPGWRRGTTMLSGETIEYSDAANTLPVSGNELVGQVKIFQDVNPSTGVRNSNRLVYCVAARYTGASDLTSADAGKVYAFSTTPAVAGAVGPLAEFSAVASNTNVSTDGRYYGVLDEYFAGTNQSIRKNDIVWLVVKGPTSVQSSGTAIAAGVNIQVDGTTAGRVAVKSTGVAIGSQIAGASVGGTAGALVRINLHNDSI